MPATAQEICDAIQTLSKDDSQLVMKAAGIYSRYTGFSSADDLISEATSRALNGTRTWKNDEVSFVKFIIGAIRSVASADRRSIAATRTDSLDATDEDGSPVMDTPRIGLSCSCPSMEQKIIEDDEILERQRQAQLDIEVIKECFANDPEAQWLIACLDAGESPSKGRENEQLTDTQYNSLRRRVRRKLEKLFPGRKRATKKAGSKR